MTGPAVNEAAFGDVAVKRGYITQPQLEASLEAHRLVLQAGLKKTLADILVDKGLITPVQAEIVKRSLSCESQVVAGFELLKKLVRAAWAPCTRPARSRWTASSR